MRPRPAALRGLCSKAEKKKPLAQWETLLEICKQYNKLARCSDLCVCTELLFTLRPAGGRAGGRVADVAARTSEAPSASCLSPTSSVQFWFQQLERRSA